MAYNRAAYRIASASTSQMPAARDADHGSMNAVNSSKPSTRVFRNSRSQSPSVTIVCAIAFRRGTLVPGLIARWQVASAVNSVRRGSMTMRWAPRRAARLMRAPTIGWLSVESAPQTRIARADSIASKELVARPEPSIAFNAAALGA